jgi:hypothetical protein
MPRPPAGNLAADNNTVGTTKGHKDISKDTSKDMAKVGTTKVDTTKVDTTKVDTTKAATGATIKVIKAKAATTKAISSNKRTNRHHNKIGINPNNKTGEGNHNRMSTNRLISNNKLNRVLRVVLTCPPRTAKEAARARVARARVARVAAKVVRETRKTRIGMMTARAK